MKICDLFSVDMSRLLEVCSNHWEHVINVGRVKANYTDRCITFTNALVNLNGIRRMKFRVDFEAKFPTTPDQAMVYLCLRILNPTVPKYLPITGVFGIMEPIDTLLNFVVDFENSLELDCEG